MINALISRIRSAWFFLSTFFPVQLFLLHLRKSHLLVIFWLLLAGFISGFLAESYGLRYIFLTPEYLHSVSFLSYFLVGVTAGLFIAAFHINSYIYYSYRYPFLATLNRPLWKFSINNSILPGLFYLFYFWNLYTFLDGEGVGLLTILSRMGALLTGSILIIAFTFTYFIGTIRTLEVPVEKKAGEKGPLHRLSKLLRKGGKPREPEEPRKFPVNHYLKNPFSVKLARHAGHYKREVLLKTIEQHHFSAAVYFVALILIVILLSLVSDNELFMIPAGATVFLIFSLYLMVIGAFYTRFKTWTVTLGILVLVFLNYLSGFDRFKTSNHAFGMNYEVSPAPYNYGVLDSLTTDSIVGLDIRNEHQVLENWKRNTGLQKPRLVILNVSGGGQRSALWALKVLQEADSASGGELYRQVHLITGSSGGMLGAAFYRELKYRQASGASDIRPWDEDMQRLMARDLLNPTCFTLAVNDLFFRMRDVEYGPYTYPLDRGYSFDRKLASNTLGLLDRKFEDYAEAEFKAELPTMILGPSIVGDGRKLLMSTRGTSYLTFTQPYAGIHKTKEYDAVEFKRFFARQDAGNLSFITALRLSASFPYITPLVNMPSDPGMELIDAGVRDNEGFELALRYIYTHQEWIRRNTSGVLVVQIKANRPNEVPIRHHRVTKFDKLSLPIGGVYRSFHNFQVYNKALLMELSHEELGLPVEIVRFALLQEVDNVSLSWHLTDGEKRRIINTFENPVNQGALEDLLEALRKSR